MADELDTLAPIEAEAPPIEQEPVEQPHDPGEYDAGDDGLGPTDDEGQEGDDEELVEFVTLERNGKKYQVPKELEHEFMKNSDYTQKTQSLAEERRQMESRRAEIDQLTTHTQDELRAAADLAFIDARLQEYSQVNWEQLEAEDLVGAQSHWRQYQQLKEQRGTATSFLEQRRQQKSQQQQQDFAKRLEETGRYAQQNIKGWTPEMGTKLRDFAISEGLSEQDIKNSISPLFIKFLHKAYVGEQALKRTATPKPQAPIAPLRTVSAKANARPRTDLASLAAGDNMEAYMAARDRGVGK